MPKNIQSKIQEQVKDAMRARDQLRLTTLRGVLSAFTNELIALKRKPQDKLTETEEVAVVRRLVKQRKDSIEQFEGGGRNDLAENEKLEMAILEEFLPAQMSEEAIRKIIKEKMEKLGKPDKAKMGQFMGLVMKETGGQAEGTLVKKIIDEMIS